MPFSEFRALCKFHGLIPGSTALTSINKITEMHPEELLQISKTPAGSSVHLLQTEGSGLVSAWLSPQQEDSGKGKAPLPYHGKESQAEGQDQPSGKISKVTFFSLRISSSLPSSQTSCTLGYLLPTRLPRFAPPLLPFSASLLEGHSPANSLVSFLLLLSPIFSTK